MDTARLLIADDNPDVGHALQLLLKGRGFELQTVSSPDAALAALEAGPYDLVLMDFNYTRDTTSGREGMDLLARIRARDAAIPVVAMTAWGTIDLAVDAMRVGLDDFIQKPWDNARLIDLLIEHVEKGRARRLRSRAGDWAPGLARELAAAGDVQRTMLPEQLPALPGFDVFATWQPAGGVGGDFYDVLRLDDEHAAFYVGDVAGKGVAAAILMASVQSLVHASTSANRSPAELCAAVNRVLCDRPVEGRFVTFFYASLDVRRRRVVFTNAGHNAPIVIRRDGTITRLDSGGPLLGFLPDAGYEQAEIELGEGDRLVLFTDGLVEARDSNHVEFGDDRLIRTLSDGRGLAAKELAGQVIGSIGEFGNGFQDDATLIVCGVGD